MFSLWRKARRENSAASRLLGSTSLRFALHGWQRMQQISLCIGKCPSGHGCAISPFGVGFSKKHPRHQNGFIRRFWICNPRQWKAPIDVFRWHIKRHLPGSIDANAF
ncbi:hypothetical protein [Thiolapillus sp.]|uniref:hypothetical protein n=1 Tax=Thiolapillus sp. TaxID=2017437 RepID=UPI0025EC8063|nr:hypothetical protein [Thiolapillus sp.]